MASDLVATSQTRRAYDHRLREQVCRTGKRCLPLQSHDHAHLNAYRISFSDKMVSRFPFTIADISRRPPAACT